MPQFNLERLLDGLNLHLRVTSMNYVARFLSQIGQFGQIGDCKNPNCIQKLEQKCEKTAKSGEKQQ